MSDKLTRLRTETGTSFPGIMDWGEKTAEEMIRQARTYAAHLRAQADEIDATADESFQIDIVRGSCVQHHVRTLQQGNRA